MADKELEVEEEEKVEEEKETEVEEKEKESETEEEKESETESESETQDEDSSEKEVPLDKKEEEDELFELPTGDKVPFNELLAGYMKDADYRRKTAELAREKERFTPRQQESATKEEEADPVLSKYDKQQLEDFKVIAKKLGFVSQDDIVARETATTKQSVIDGFFNTHKEYMKENDPGDVRYGALIDELSLYNLNDIKKLPDIFKRAHEAVEGKFSSGKEKAKALAQRERVKLAGVGSKASGAAAKEEDNSDYTEAQISVMKKMGVWTE